MYNFFAILPSLALLHGTTLADAPHLMQEGTADCSYFAGRCEQNGGEYYCKEGPNWCTWFPDDDGWANCTRRCLQECDESVNDADPLSPYYDDEQGECVGGGEVPDNSSPIDHLSPGFADNFACHATCYLWCAVSAIVPSKEMGK